MASRAKIKGVLRIILTGAAMAASGAKTKLQKDDFHGLFVQAFVQTKYGRTHICFCTTIFPFLGHCEMQNLLEN